MNVNRKDISVPQRGTDISEEKKQANVLIILFDLREARIKVSNDFISRIDVTLLKFLHSFHSKKDCVTIAFNIKANDSTYLISNRLMTKAFSQYPPDNQDAVYSKRLDQQKLRLSEKILQFCKSFLKSFLNVGVDKRSI